MLWIQRCLARVFISWKPIVLILGNYSSGKSTLINELLSQKIQSTGQLLQMTLLQLLQDSHFPTRMMDIRNKRWQGHLE